MPGQNKTKGTKKLFISKKIRTRAFLEEDAIGTATAGPLGPRDARSLKKIILLTKVFLGLGGSLAPSKVVDT
jgi:hypothetical protein